MKMLNKKGQASSFQFIAKYPSAMLIAGGILFLLINKEFIGMILIALGIGLHILWLRR